MTLSFLEVDPITPAVDTAAISTPTAVTPVLTPRSSSTVRKPSAPWGDHLSHSQIRTCMECPRRWHYQYIVQAPQERVGSALAFGIALHDALAEVNECTFSGGVADPRGTFLRRWHDYTADVVTPLHLSASADQAALLATGLALVDTYQPPAGIIGVEQPFEIDLADDLPPVTGRIDLIRQLPDGRLVIADLKTASSRKLTELDAVEAQLGLYDLAYPATDHEAIVLAKLATPVVTVQPITPWPRARLVQHYREVIHAMRSGVRFACRSWFCASCPFRDRCRAEG